MMAFGITFINRLFFVMKKHNANAQSIACPFPLTVQFLGRLAHDQRSGQADETRRKPKGIGIVSREPESGQDIDNESKAHIGYA